jgi:hypothetical protein
LSIWLLLAVVAPLLMALRNSFQVMLMRKAQLLLRAAAAQAAILH